MKCNRATALGVAGGHIDPRWSTICRAAVRLNIPIADWLPPSVHGEKVTPAHVGTLQQNERAARPIPTPATAASTEETGARVEAARARLAEWLRSIPRHRAQAQSRRNAEHARQSAAHPCPSPPYLRRDRMSDEPKTNETIAPTSEEPRTSVDVETSTQPPDVAAYAPAAEGGLALSQPEPQPPAASAASVEGTATNGESDITARVDAMSHEERRRVLHGVLAEVARWYMLVEAEAALRTQLDEGLSRSNSIRARGSGRGRFRRGGQ